jgi:hypothetical protein
LKFGKGCFWMDEWVDVRAFLRIAYKSKNSDQTIICPWSKQKLDWFRPVSKTAKRGNILLKS